MDGLHPHTEAGELLGQTVGAVLGAAEHDRRAGEPDHVGGELHLGVAVGAPEDVRRVRLLLGVVGEHVAHRVLLVAAHERVDRAVERGREEQRLARVGGLVEELAHLGQEAHVGHAVGLVDHDRLHRGQVDFATLDEVLEPSGAGHEDVGAAPHRLQLRAEAGAAVHRGHAQLARAAQPRELTAHLRGQLARGHEHEADGPVRVSPAEPGDHRDAEGEGLARAGVGLARHVTAGHAVGDGHGLDGEGGVDAPGVQGRDDVIGHAEIGEGFHGVGTPIVWCSLNGRATQEHADPLGTFGRDSAPANFPSRISRV